MAIFYIKPSSTSLNFIWDNDNYISNAFDSSSQIQMLDGISGIDININIGVTDIDEVFNKYQSNVDEIVGVKDEDYDLRFTLQFLESIGILEELESRATMGTELSEILGVSDENELHSKLFLVFNDNIQVNDDLTINAEMQVSLQEAIGNGVYVEDFKATKTVTGGTTEIPSSVSIIKSTDLSTVDTFVMNYTNKAFSRYKNFSFNSGTKFLGEYFIANANGIFINNGFSDGVNSIKAGIKTGLIRFSGNVKSRIDFASLAIKNNGTMKVKLIGSDGLSHVYDLVTTSTQTFTEKIIKFGKGDGVGGLRACTYFQFEITNGGGGDFELDNLAVYKLELSRIT